MEPHGRNETFRPREAADLAENFVTVRRQLRPGGVLIGTVGEFALRMEGEPEPVAVRLKFSLVGRREIRDGKIVMVIMKKQIEQKFRTVLFMDGSQSPEEHLVEKRSGSFQSDPAQKKGAVVDKEVVPPERPFVPHYRQGQGTVPVVIRTFGRDFVYPLRQADFCGEIPVPPLNGLTVHPDLRLRGGNAFHGDFQMIGRFDPVMTIQDGARAQIGDFEHFLPV